MSSSNTLSKPKYQNSENCSALTLKSDDSVFDKRVRKQRVKHDKEDSTVDKLSPYDKIPFPQALVKGNLERKFLRFLEVFKKLGISLPFSEALEQMSSFSKFMKGDL